MAFLGYAILAYDAILEKGKKVDLRVYLAMQGSDR